MRYFDTPDWKGSAITCGKDKTTPCPMGGSLCPSPWNLSLTVSCNVICYTTKGTMRTLVTHLSLFTYYILAAPTHLSTFQVYIVYNVYISSSAWSCRRLFATSQSFVTPDCTAANVGSDYFQDC